MRIIISPLNWGLGHATRITPLIRLLSRKHKVIIAADGLAYNFLKKEFPELEIIELKKFQIKYTSKKFLMPLKILALLPVLLKYYLYNKKIIKDLIKKHKPSLIISDNRFGFFSKDIKSIIITHQLNIQLPPILRIFKPFADYLNIKNITKFDEVWIPDDITLKISGKLSDKKISKPVFYTGLLSRFQVDCKDVNIAKSLYYVGIASGPEPQKSIFCSLLKKMFLQTDKQSLLICGEPDKNYSITKKNLTIVSHLHDEDMKKVLCTAKQIITRSGYSSIMDLISLKRTALIVPTPGQSEQEYLADYLHKKNLFFSVEQKKLSYDVLSLFDKKNTDLSKNVASLQISSLLDFLYERKIL